MGPMHTEPAKKDFYMFTIFPHLNLVYNGKFQRPSHKFNNPDVCQTVFNRRVYWAVFSLSFPTLTKFSFDLDFFFFISSKVWGNRWTLKTMFNKQEGTCDIYYYLSEKVLLLYLTDMISHMYSTCVFILFPLYILKRLPTQLLPVF